MTKETMEKIAESNGLCFCECGVMMIHCPEHFLDIPAYMRAGKPTPDEVSVFPLDDE